MSKAGEQIIEGMREALTMAKLDAENARLRDRIEALEKALADLLATPHNVHVVEAARSNLKVIQNRSNCR